MIATDTLDALTAEVAVNAAVAHLRITDRPVGGCHRINSSHLGVPQLFSKKRNT